MITPTPDDASHHGNDGRQEVIAFADALYYVVSDHIHLLTAAEMIGVIECIKADVLDRARNE